MTRPDPPPKHGTFAFDPATQILEVTTLLNSGKTVERHYHVAELVDHPAVPGPVYLLTQPDGTSYVVAVEHYGAICECPDFQHRRCNAKPGLECKHVRALIGAGKLKVSEQGRIIANAREAGREVL
jgi:hypothetical protein